MFRLATKLVRSHRERFLSLVMVPAFFLATLPDVDCICADGQRRAHCNLLACCAAKDGKTASGSCGCSSSTCNPAEKGAACCMAAHQPIDATQNELPAFLARNTGCCNPYLEAAAPAVLAGKFTELQSPTSIGLVAPQTLAYEGAANAVSRAFDYHGPPPRDAVILFQHLTI